MIQNLLQTLKKQVGIDIFVTLSREVSKYQGCWSGRLNTPLISQAIGGDFSNKTFMTCGPQSMMTMVKNTLLEKNVHLNNIKLESFES